MSKYINKRLKYLPKRIQDSYKAILNGQPDSIDSYQTIFENYPKQYLYDAGRLFVQLRDAYQDIVAHPKRIKKYTNLIKEIESIPLSWAGNFIGPEVGTLHDGAILSALYLYLLHKSEKIC